MFKLDLLLLLTLVSFSHQDKHCLITFEHCVEESKEAEPESDIAHCLYEQNDECVTCEHDYLPSSNKKKCLYFPNCAKLDGDDSDCASSSDYF